MVLLSVYGTILTAVNVKKSKRRRRRRMPFRKPTLQSIPGQSFNLNDIQADVQSDIGSNVETSDRDSFDTDSSDIFAGFERGDSDSETTTITKDELCDFEDTFQNIVSPMTLDTFNGYLCYFEGHFKSETEKESLLFWIDSLIGVSNDNVITLQIIENNVR